MARPLSWAFAALLVLYGPRVGAAELCNPTQQRGVPPKTDAAAKPGDREEHGPQTHWWIDPKLRAELSVTDQQSAAVEQIWQKSVPQLRDARARLEKLEDGLTQLTRDDSVDETTVIAQIDRVETARAEAIKLRTVMLYRMNRVLTPDQRARVRAMFEKRDQQRRSQSPR
jgi:Spy/CpxP family protein refolding chaperone